MNKSFFAITVHAILGTALLAQTSGAAPESLDSVLRSLGTQWRVHEQFKPEWDWSGTWTREGNSNTYVAHYVNAGRNALKTADFRVTAESFSNSVLRFRHPQNGYYDIRLKPGERTGAGTMSWCVTVGCAFELEFAGTLSEKPGGESVSRPPVASLTGPWVHSADARTQTPDSRVILIQDGSRVTLTNTWRTNGRWVTLVCQGSLSGIDLPMQCAYAPGGNPFGFANTFMNLKLSADGNHLDGGITAPPAAIQESHYSRLP
jgi:hypothetical protein